MASLKTSTFWVTEAMTDLEIAKIDVAVIQDGNTFRNEIDKRKVTPEQPKTKPY